MLYDQFIEKITSNCQSNEEKCIEILRARGFLIHKDENGYFLSDNSYLKKDFRKNDLEFLNEILSKYKIGEIKEGYINIFLNAKADQLKTIFYSENVCEEEEGEIPANLKKFIHNEYGRKVPVSILDPFVARYVKAISACGVDTVSSCDGNDHCEKYILVDTNGVWFEEWHKIICEYFMPKSLCLPWNENYEKIYFHKNKLEIYYSLNKAAEYLYNNRIELREIKKEALVCMKKKAIIKKYKNSITNQFIQNVLLVTDKRKGEF